LQPPAVLTIQLKRFSFTPRAPKHIMEAARRGDKRAQMALMMQAMGGQRKLVDVIAFGESLDIAPALAPEAIPEVRPSQGGRCRSVCFECCCRHHSCESP
jgi:hypothetical protein